MISLPSKYIPFTIMASLVLVMGLIVWLGILPLKQAVMGKMDDIQKMYTSRENRERQISRLPELEEQSQEIQSGAETMHILLSENHIVDFIKTLEDLGREAGVDVSIESKEGGAIIEKKPAASPAPATADSGTVPAGGVVATAPSGKSADILDNLPFDRYLHISVMLKGKYADIIAFLHKMETLPFALDVVGLEIHAATNESDQSGTIAPASGINPFVAVSGNNASAGSSAPPAGPIPEKPLEAAIDTVVYIDK